MPLVARMGRQDVENMPFVLLINPQHPVKSSLNETMNIINRRTRQELHTLLIFSFLIG